MKGVRKAKKVMSRLVPKNHFCSMEIFREPPLVNWTFTDTILLTAYDVYRSSDFWVDSIVSSGSTLKEAMVNLGFPRGKTMMADTGIFEFEAKKAGIAKELGITVDMSLSNDEIFEAYRLSGADFFVSPDEIILPTDTRLEVRKKIAKIKDNLRDLLEIVKPRHAIAVIQGCDKHTIDTLYDFFLENGIRLFARGGLIPLWKHDNALFERVLAYSRKLTKKYWLHAFGLPRVSLLPQYLHSVGMNSVDSSTLSYVTARRMYLIGVDTRPVRLADFESCDCDGCKILMDMPPSRSSLFFVGLYIHNVTEASRIAAVPNYAPPLLVQEEKHPKPTKAIMKKPADPIGAKQSDDWRTAYEDYRKRTRPS